MIGLKIYYHKNMKEFSPISSEMLFLKEKIFSPECHVFFDVDGTIKGSSTPEAPTGFNPKLPSLLARLNKIPGISVGACTSQSSQELYSYLLKMDPKMGGHLMDGLSILEDGHILVSAGINMLTDYIELVSPGAKAQISILKVELKKHWAPAQESHLASDGWGYFPDVPTPVAIPEGKYQGVVTMSVWERGPNVHDPDYHGEYEQIALFVHQLIKELNLDSIEPKEAGNGTLRIVEKGKSKESALATLANKGVIDLKNTVYVGDGLNDVESAELISDAGGGVIAVANAISELKQKATCVSKEAASHGVVEMLELILN